MPLETFAGPAVPPLLLRATRVLGGDAVIVNTRRILGPDGGPAFEVLAGDPASATTLVEEFRVLGRRPEIAPRPPLATGQAGRRPYVVALVGPTGAGKTTTIAKLFGHPKVFESARPGLLSLDTYRVGAVEQLRTYAEIADVPLEVVYDTKSLARGVRQLAHAGIILVDTPGRGPHRRRDTEIVLRWLHRLHPDETHLVLPCGLRPEFARSLATQAVATGVTHLLVTKLDECPDDPSLFDLAAELRLPMRWVTNGQEVPTDLRPARPRLLASMAMTRARRPTAAVASA